jgi:hypothetical protein
VLGHVAKMFRQMQAGTVQRFSTQRKVQTESSRHPDGWCLDSRAFGRNITSFGRMQGIRFLWLGICAESSRNITLIMKTLKITKSLYKSIITYKWFCPTECSQLQTNTFNFDTKLIVNASQPSLLLEGVFNEIIYLKADLEVRLYTKQRTNTGNG